MMMKQIIKTSNSVSKMNFMDCLYAPNAKKDGYAKKVILNIHNYSNKKHAEEKGVGFYWDLEEVLLIAEDIVNGTFSQKIYNTSKEKKIKGMYEKFGGGKVSRILCITYKEGNYLLSNAIYEPIRTQTGAILPNKEKRIDAHSIQLSEHEMRKIMNYVKTYLYLRMNSLVNPITETKQA